MEIVVCVKQTADTAATLTVEGGKPSWGETPLVLNPWDEYAVEQALVTKEQHGGTVTALCLGPESAKEALKQALAMGCDAAVLINDPALDGADTLAASAALAAGVKKLEAIELAFFGKSSVDSDTAITGPQVARRLGWPSLSLVAAVSELEPGGSITVERLLEQGREVVRAPLPAVVSVVKEINEPRYPSFMGIRKASKAEIPIWTLAEIELDPPQPALEWPEVVVPPKTDTECEFIEGDTPAEMGAKLAERLIEEKVI